MAWRDSMRKILGEQPADNEDNEYNEYKKQRWKIEKTGVCCHGRPCRNLESEPPDRPLCRMNREPVFDLEECPAHQWRAYRQGAETLYVLTAGRGK